MKKLLVQHYALASFCGTAFNATDINHFEVNYRKKTQN